MKCAFKGCIKSTKLISFECKCKNIFCMNHRLQESHNCTHREPINKLEFIKNLECVSEKVIKI